jgi:hypothetical protein
VIPSIPVPTEDVRRIGDYMVASLLLSALRLIARKGILEPIAAWAGRQALRRAWRWLRRQEGAPADRCE